MTEDDIIEKIIERATRGEDLLDESIIDIAFDQFVEIKKLAQQLKSIRQTGE